MQEQNDFHRVVQELSKLLNQLPPGTRWTIEREILRSLNRIAHLLANLEAEKSALERTIALLDAEAIIADKDGDE